MSEQKNDTPSTPPSLHQTSAQELPKLEANSFPFLFKNKSNYYYLALALICVLVCIIRKNFFDIPFERDEGFYMYSGKDLLHGAIPFKDIGSQRLDGIYYAYAFLVLLFGYTIQKMHLAFMLINICSTIIMFFLVRKLTNNLIGIAAALFFVLLSMTLMADGFTVQSEHLVTLFSLSGFLALIHFLDKKNIPLLIVCGLFFFLGFEMKQTSFFYGFFAGFIIVLNGILDTDKNYTRILKHAVIF